MKRVALAVTAAAVGAGLAAPAAIAGGAETHIEFDLIEYVGIEGETVYRGEIFSDRRKCLLDRKVTVFRKRSGDDLKIGTTEANEDKPGEFGWALYKPGPPKSGVYYAKAKAITGCLADKSAQYGIG